MAALLQQRPTPLIDLRELQPAYLDPLLAEEAEEWRRSLDWDFAPSADLVRRFMGMRSLCGYALPAGSGAAGYVYYVSDEGKGLIGGLYVARAHRSVENENTLIGAVLESLWRIPGVRRIEAQLMMVESPLCRPVPYAQYLRTHARQFFEAPLAHIAQLPPRQPAVIIAPWAENRQSDAGRLIAAAYANHIDSEINDQYRSPGGARRFLANIVQYPGCGLFFAPGSFVAFSASGQGLCGLSLASVVAEGVGHITQLCVAPSHRATGLGYELLRRSLVALAAHGCGKVTLTVTASNTPAIRLYERMGFVNRRDFAAYVWEIR
jgi:ribosomal protein S18 acetylase RimI-like enzyme